MANSPVRRITPQMRLVEVKLGEPLPELLGRLRRKGLTVAAIARVIGVPYGTVRRWLVEYALDDATLIRAALGDQP